MDDQAGDLTCVCQRDVRICIISQENKLLVSMFEKQLRAFSQQKSNNLTNVCLKPFPTYKNSATVHFENIN